MSTTQFNFEFLGFKGEIFFDTKKQPSDDGQFVLLKPMGGSAGNGSMNNIKWNGKTLTGTLSGSMDYRVGSTQKFINHFEGTCVLTFNDDLTSFTGKYSDAQTQAAFQKISFTRTLTQGHKVIKHPYYYPDYLSGATASTSKVKLPGKTTAAPKKRVTLIRCAYGSSVESPWFNAIPTKETNDFRLIEFYYDQTAHTIYLYQITKEFLELSSMEKKYQILTTDGTLKSGHKPLVRAFPVKEMIGHDYLNPLPDNVAFDQILPLVFFEIFQRFPSDVYGVRYSGHGSSKSMLGEYAVGHRQCRILRAINTMLERKIDFLDWSCNCNTGSLYNLLSQYQYANYIIAADLERTDSTKYGIGSSKNPDHKYFADYKYSLAPEEKYPGYFAGGKDVPTALKAFMDYTYDYWTDAGFNYAQEMENLTLFDTSKFQALWNLIEGIVNGDNETLSKLRACTYWEGMVPYSNIPIPPPAPKTKILNESRHIDVKLFIQKYIPNAISQWNDLICHHINNKNYLDWDNPKYVDYTGEARDFPDGLSFPNGLSFHRYSVTTKADGLFFPWDNTTSLNPVIFKVNDYI